MIKTALESAVMKVKVKNNVPCSPGLMLVLCLSGKEMAPRGL